MISIKKLYIIVIITLLCMLTINILLHRIPIVNKEKVVLEYNATHKVVGLPPELQINQQGNFGLIILSTECITCYDVLQNWNDYLKQNSQFLTKIYFLMIGGRNDYWQQYEDDFNNLNIIHINNSDDLNPVLLQYSRNLVILNKKHQIEYVYTNRFLEPNTKIIKYYLNNEE